MIFDDAVKKFLAHLKNSLELPFLVTGIEDLLWEEFYVLGPGDPLEYELLKKEKPSDTDTFELISIDLGEQSNWMTFYDDIQAQVKRRTDSREYILGLSELVSVDKTTSNYQILDDYAVWFVNNR